MTRGNATPVPLVDRRPAPPSLAERIRALGKTPAQVRAWAEANGIPLPRHGVDDDAVTAYEQAHPVTAGARRAKARAEQAPADPGRPGGCRCVVIEPRTLQTPDVWEQADDCPVHPLKPVDLDRPRAGEPSDPPCEAQCGLSWPHAAPCAPMPSTEPEQPAPLAIPIDGPDPVELAELGGVILWPHPARYAVTAAPATEASEATEADADRCDDCGAPAGTCRCFSDACRRYDDEHTDDAPDPDPAEGPRCPDCGTEDCQVLPYCTPSTDEPTPAPLIDIRQALAAARRLGGQGVPLPRLVDYVTAIDAALPLLPAPCIVCRRPVTAEHIARTGQPIHGDPHSRTSCWASYIERKTA